MGTVIGFPEQERAAREGRVIAGQPQSATVIILPVIRIERYSDEPAEDTAGRGQRRRRRRPASRGKAGD